MSKYSWTPDQVFSLLGVQIRSTKAEQKILCPYCGSKNLNFNLVKDVGHCFSCDRGIDSRQYYSVVTGTSLEKTGYEIEERLGIRPSNREMTPPPQRIVFKYSTKEATKASPEVLDTTYRAFLGSLELSVKNRDNLRSRGLHPDEITRLCYRTFPSERLDIIPRDLGQSGFTITGVPGFYIEKGTPKMVRMTPGIIMPQVNRNSLITGLQIRKDDDLRRFNEDSGEYEAKCGWFSSKGRENGTPASADVHYACDFSYDEQSKQYMPVLQDGKILLTEGIMKGDIVHYCMGGAPVIAVPGVNAVKKLTEELIWMRDNCGLRKVILAFDMDYQTNPNVQKALENTRTMIKDCGLECAQFPSWEPHLVRDGEEYNINGIDDYLVFCKYDILPHVKLH